MDNLEYEAIILENKIVCGKCGHVIAKKQGDISTFGKGTLYLKCNHRDGGVNCRTINVIKVN